MSHKTEFYTDAGFDFEVAFPTLKFQFAIAIYTDYNLQVLLWLYLIVGVGNERLSSGTNHFHIHSYVFASYICILEGTA